MPSLRAYRFDDEGEGGEPAAEGSPLRFLASSNSSGIRDDLEIDHSRWFLDNYAKNPVVLWAHDYSQPPIGRGEASVTDRGLEIAVTFDQGDPFAREIERKYRDRFLNAVSIGWTDTKVDGKDVHDLWELSGVPVPADPDALADRQLQRMRALGRELMSIGGKTLPCATCGTDVADLPDEAEAAWCGTCALKAPTAALTRGRARYVTTAAKPNGEGTWRDIATSMVGVFTPQPDDTDKARRRAYNALLPAYRRAGKEPPEFLELSDLQALGDAEWKGLFLEGELESTGLTRVGAELSSKNRTTLEEVTEAIEGAGKALRALLKATAKQDDTDDDEAARAALQRIRDAFGAVTPTQETTNA